MENSAAIGLAGMVLAAGHGTRMKSEVPKVLHPVLGRPLLDYPLSLLEGMGASRVAVVVGSGAAEVEAAFSRRRFSGSAIEWCLQDPPRGTGDAVRIGLAGLSTVTDPVFILNGDLPLLEARSLFEMVALHRDSDAALTLLTLELRDPTGYGRIVRDAQGEIDRIVEEADATGEERRITEVNGGVYLADPQLLGQALEAWIAVGQENTQGEIYFPPVVGTLRAAGGRVVPYQLPPERATELAQVNDRVDLARVTSLRRAQVVERHQRSGVTIVDPASTVIEEGVVIGRDTTIHPFTVIQSGVRIGKRCQIGPFSHLRVGARLEERAEIGNFTEVKNTRLGAGSKAKHLSYLGDGDIGRGVNIGAGTILANYDGKKKSPTIIGDGAFIGSGTILVAPVEVGSNAQTGAGAVVTRGRDVPSGATVIGVPARPLRKTGESDD